MLKKMIRTLDKKKKHPWVKHENIKLTLIFNFGLQFRCPYQSRENTQYDLPLLKTGMLSKLRVFVLFAKGHFMLPNKFVLVLS
jgi:hypothetical protein